MITSDVALPPGRLTRLTACTPEGAAAALPGVEVDARPGTPLGGPYTTRASTRQDLRRVARAQLPAAHFAYLRETYLIDSRVREQLDYLAGLVVNGSVRVLVVTTEPEAARSVIEAATRLARRLAPLVREDA